MTSSFPPPAPAQPGSRYSKESVDLSGWLDVHAMTLGVIGAGADVLDVGCADGSLARLLRLRGARVWGVDSDDDALANAKAHCEATRKIDLDGEFREPLRALLRSRAGRRFPYVTLLDVLEHLRRPEEVLTFLVQECLEPYGRMVLSIPNVTHGAVRLSMLQGRFDYADKGLLDRTHIRFFDRVGVDQLLQDARLRTVVEYSYPAGYFSTEIAVDEALVGVDTVRRLAADDDSFTYQFFRVAVGADLSMEGGFELASISLMRNELAVRTQLGEEKRSVQQELEFSKKREDRLRIELAGLQEKDVRLGAEVANLSSGKASLEMTLEQVHASLEWRVGRCATSPLRAMRRFAHRVKQNTREHPE